MHQDLFKSCNGMLIAERLINSERHSLLMRFSSASRLKISFRSVTKLETIRKILKLQVIKDLFYIPIRFN